VRRFLGLALVLLAFFFSQVAHAQTLPAVTSDDQMGMQPYQSYHGGDIDSISLGTGTLNLNVPFLSYPQRGKLHLSFNLFYNNQWQHQGELCVNIPNPPPCTWYWGWTTVGSPLPIERSDAFVGSAQAFAVPGAGVALTSGSPPSTTTIHYANLSLQLADGSKHPLANLGTFVKTGQAPTYFEQYGGPWETLDATAWRVNGTFLASNIVGNITETPTSIVGPDGVAYGSATTFEEDPNGNMITVNNGTYSDSLNRQIPSPPTAASSSNTSSSACPQTLLPVDHAVLWSPPGPDGTTEPYTFCYAKVAINIPQGASEYYPGVSGGSFMKLQSIVLPNGQFWDFQYNDPGDGSMYNGAPINYATLTQVTLPTGGTISYSYAMGGGGGISCQNGGRWVASRTVNANDGTGPHTWTYVYTVINNGN